MTEHKRRITIISLCTLLFVLLVTYAIVLSKTPPDTDKTSSTQSTAPALEERNKEQSQEEYVEPDINNESFTLTGSNVNCSSSSINGQTVRSCSGTITIYSQKNQNLGHALYKINENTKLLNNGEEQDLQLLHQLAQANTTVTLKLADNSTDTLSEIRYQ